MDLLTIIIGAVVFLTTLLVRHLWRNRGRLEALNIPVLKPGFLLGSPPHLQHKVLVHEEIANMHKKLGKTFGRYEGIMPVISTIDPEIIKSVMVKNFDSFTDIFEMDVS